MKHTICFVCDFFYPNFGGVENHIYYLAKGLQSRGHKVLVITHEYAGADHHDGLCYIANDRTITPSPSPNSSSVRLNEDNLSELDTSIVKGKSEKNILQTPPSQSQSRLPVYYLPKTVVYQQATLPSLYSIYYLQRIKDIFINEGVSIVHGHQSTSTMAHECIFIARAMGLHTVFTEHSLYKPSVSYYDIFSFDSFVNFFLRITLSNVDHVICVSNSCKENLLQRANKDKDDNESLSCSTIPNAIDPQKFKPNAAMNMTTRDANTRVKVIVMSRLVYRKGIDLLVQLMPDICQQYPEVDFLIGGDGPKCELIELMLKENHSLFGRVELVGAVQHNDVRDVLIKGDIFLNCSYTESFCVSLIEAASCGLRVISTNVGGVPEVLPSDMTILVEPNVGAM